MQVLKCRNQITTIKNTKVSVMYCDNECQHFSIVDTGNNCQCCGSHIVKKRTFKAERKRFEEIIRNNRSIIDEWMSFPGVHHSRPSWLIKFGHVVYLVDIKYFAEYDEMCHLEGTDLMENFIKNVKKASRAILIGLHDV